MSDSSGQDLFVKIRVTGQIVEVRTSHPSSPMSLWSVLPPGTTEAHTGLSHADLLKYGHGEHDIPVKSGHQGPLLWRGESARSISPTSSS